MPTHLRVTAAVSLALACLTALALGYVVGRPSRSADPPAAPAPPAAVELPATPPAPPPPAPPAAAPAPAPPPPAKPPIDNDADYQALITTLKEKVPGVHFAPRPAGPGRIITGPGGDQALVIAGVDPDTAEKDLRAEARPGWEIFRWGPYVFGGGPAFIDVIRTALTAKAPAVPPRPAPAGPAPKAVPADPEVAQLMDQLTHRDPKQRVAAAKALQQLGERARPAAKALCRVVLDRSRQVSDAGLHALAVAAPEIHDPVKDLLVDAAEANHRQALERLTELGSQARPAGPVLAEYVISTFRVAPTRLSENALALAAVTAFRAVASDDPDALEPLLRHVNWFANTPLGAVTYVHLGELGEARPEVRPRIVKALAPRLRGESTYKLEVIEALGKQGADAKKALPGLQLVYDRHPSKDLRDAAREAIRRINGA